MNRKSLLVFGGGPLQISIINNAKNLGFYVIVIDPDESAIGRKVADKFFRVDGDDFGRTLQIAQNYNIKGIITSATDKPLLMMARIAEEMSLNFPSYKSILNTIDKYKLKNILLENDLNCAKGHKYNSNNLPQPDSINYPVIIKPTSNSGSRGVVLCDTSKDFDKVTEEALSQSKGEILIEEYIDGDEVSIEALVYNNEVKILQITDKLVTPPPYNVEVGQIQPSKYLDQYFTLIQEYLQKLIDILKLNNCAIHPEFKINKSGVFLLEMGPRLGGDFITSHLVPLSTGINMEKALIQIATNYKVNLKKPKKNAALIKYITLPEGAIVKENPDVKKIYAKYQKIHLLKINLKKEDVITKITNSLNRYGYFIISEEKVSELISQAEEISNNIKNETLKI